MIPRALTVDGIEIQFATNHLGPFLLTNLLLEILKSTAPSRIVNVSSVAHHMGTIDRDNLMGERSNTALQTYCHTKLCNVLFTRELAKRLQGTNVTANSLHPGVVGTDILRNASGLMWIFYPAMKMLFRSAKSGAITTITCALDPDLKGVSGKYFEDCRIKGKSKAAEDDDTANWLWRTSEKLTGLVL